MNTIGAAMFKEQCLALLDRLDAEGLVVTKHGKPVARVIPYHEHDGDLIGSPCGIRSRFGETSLRPVCAGMRMINLDTHMVVYTLSGELRSHEQELLIRQRWSVSAIVLWELAKLVQLGRIEINLDDREVVRILNRSARMANRSRSRPGVDSPRLPGRSGR